MNERSYDNQDRSFLERNISDIAEAVCVMLFDERREPDHLCEEEQRYFTETADILMDVKRKIYKVNDIITAISVILAVNGAICLEFSLDLTPDRPDFPENLRYSFHPVPPMTATSLEAIVRKVIQLAQLGQK